VRDCDQLLNGPRKRTPWAFGAKTRNVVPVMPDDGSSNKFAPIPARVEGSGTPSNVMWYSVPFSRHTPMTQTPEVSAGTLVPSTTMSSSAVPGVVARKS